MKDAISGMGLYVIVILFIALFTTYVSVTTTYSRCYRIKDELLNIIEYHHGYNSDSQASIESVLAGMGYNTSGQCPNDGTVWKGYPNSYAASPKYCIAKMVTASQDRVATTQTNAGVGMYDSAYYQVAIFFRLEWPIFRNVFNVTITGETNRITNPKDDFSDADSNYVGAR